MSETIAGGYFLDPGGKSAHDANGNPVPLRVEPVTVEPEQPVKPKTKKVAPVDVVPVEPEEVPTETDAQQGDQKPE